MSHPHLDAFHPPPGFVPVRSHVDGVEVYAPAAPNEEMAQRTRCVACGAGLTWDPSAGAVACPYCGHQEAAREGARAAEGAFTEEALVLDAKGWGGERRALHCDGCGVDLALDPGKLATTCPLCGSAQVALRPAPTEALRPTEVLPFTVDARAAQEAAKAWLTEGWMRPAGIAGEAHLDRMQGVYLPYWVFHAEMSAKYTVEVGRHRTVVERHGNTTITRTVTDWSWAEGTVEGASGELAVPGTSKVPSLDRAGSFPLDRRVPYTPDVLVGFAAQGHDITLAEAWETGRARLRQQAAGWCKRQAGGDVQRNLEATVDLREERWSYVLLPVWTSAFTYGGKSWVVLVNGGSGSVGGTRPVAWGRVWLVVAALITPGPVLGVCVGLPTLVFAGAGLIVWVFAMILLVIGGAVAVAIYQKAVHEEGT